MRSKLVLLVFSAVLLISAAAIAVEAPFPYTLSAGKNLMAVPAVPLDPDPAAVFGSIPIDGVLIRWDAATQSSHAYDEWDPDYFGNVLIGEGYWLTTASGASSSYQGLTDTDSMDIWISLPKAGWNLIGNPFSYEYTWGDAKVTDGNETISLAEARDRGWLVSVATWWDASAGSSRDVGCPDDWCYTDLLLPWHGYWVRSNIDKIALILEAP
jgi:hypothetical protein